MIPAQLRSARLETFYGLRCEALPAEAAYGVVAYARLRRDD